MIFLSLAVVCSAMTSVFMRLSKNRIQNNMAMFMVNYLICGLFSRLFLGAAPLLVMDGEFFGYFILSIIGGFLFLFGFIFTQICILKSGVVMSSLFMKLGVLIPTIVAIIAFGEVLGAPRLAGIIIAVFAIVIMNFQRGEGKGSSGLGYLILLLVISGFADSMVNVFDELFSGYNKDRFLFFLFISAFVFAFVFWIGKKQRICRWDVAFGIMLGVPNYFSSRFLLLSLGELPAVLVYPVFSVATIVVLTVFGILAFKEKLNRQKIIAMTFMLTALVLINI